MLLSAGSLAALLFLKYNWFVASIPTHNALPADLAHAASDLRVHQDDQEGHKDEVGVAKDIFQEEKFKPIEMIKTRPIQ